MKHILVLLTAAAVCLTALAADKQETKKTPSWFNDITIAPVGVHQQAKFSHGPSEWGAGFQIEKAFGPDVRIGVRNLAFESNDYHTSGGKKTEGGWEKSATGVTYQDDWGGSAIDETFAYGRYDFLNFLKKKVSIFGSGGGGYSWRHDEWLLGVGGGIQWNINNRFSVGLAEEIDVGFRTGKAFKTLGSLNFKF